MKRGDIILITVPFSDLASTKVRPALVVSPVSQAENDIVVALITTNIGRSLQPSDHALSTTDNDFGSTGLRFDSVFRMSKLYNLEKALAKRQLGSASSALMKKLNKKLKVALGLR
jgi:mRNA interferase MazF